MAGGAPPDKRVRQRAAYAEEFVEALPAGYDARLARTGPAREGRGSGAIRALYKNALILILTRRRPAGLRVGSPRRRSVRQLIRTARLVIAHRLRHAAPTGSSCSTVADRRGRGRTASS
jgi:hypothetical protein